ncbi:hypothetical protein CNY89_05885 [Amaricoccus sp. HAR-UPW-R2A-40]|nr:hypothetical protein CNY89_05885 [Amaricoccus sp. HAR-UPW-R2A-40]
MAARGAPVILGIERIDAGEDGDRWFNSLAVLGPDSLPLAIYDKHRLVPFGEYVPLGGLLARLGPQVATLTTRGFTPGPGPTRISVPGVPPFLPLICYEAVFPQAMWPPEGRSDWLVQVTNDAWFGELSGPYQHLAQARPRDRAGPAAGAIGQYRNFGDDRPARADHGAVAAGRSGPYRRGAARCSRYDSLFALRQSAAYPHNVVGARINCLQF